MTYPPYPWWTEHPDGSSEANCRECGEPILMFDGDHVSLEVGARGVVFGVLCEPCAKKRIKEGSEAL